MPTTPYTGRLAPVAAAMAALLAVAAAPSQASSHREAPFITTQPKVDATDLYLFNSYEPGRDGYVTMIANYLPLQAPYGGPNYFALDPNALYEIHVDNDGDAKEDLSFQFRFNNKLKGVTLPIGEKNVAIPLIQAGQVTDRNAPALNVNETFTLDVVRGDRRAGHRDAVTNAAGGGKVFDKPVDNIGTKTIPDYAGYAAKHLYDVRIPGCAMPGRVFVGQRKDPFAVNLGTIFDLVNAKVEVAQRDVDAQFGAAGVAAKLQVGVAGLVGGRGQRDTQCQHESDSAEEAVQVHRGLTAGLEGVGRAGRWRRAAPRPRGVPRGRRQPGRRAP
jgi:Domain of unknown function (DUF4331)